MNSSWCPEQERDKKTEKTSLHIVKDKSKVNPKDKLVQNKNIVFGLRATKGGFKSNSNAAVRLNSKKKISYLSLVERKTLNSRLLSKLSNKYVLRKSLAVISFIEEHQELVYLLDEAYEEIRKYFSSEDLRLELVSDPEIAEDQQLFVYIFTALPVTDALKKLDKFDEQWWLDRLDSANGLLNFNLRFV